MAYNQPTQGWPNMNYGMGPLFGDNTEDQDQVYLGDTSGAMFTNMASIENNPQGAGCNTQPMAIPNTPMTRWAMQKKEEPYYFGRDQVASASLDMHARFGDQQYRDALPSDGGASSVTGQQDSGYVTRPLTSFSAGSADEPSSFNKECSSIEGGMKNMKAQRRTSRASSSRLSVPSRTGHRVAREHAGIEESERVELVCPHTACGKVFKLQSELKKHRLKHDRPFKCTVAECDRSFNGFTTTNDLDRHKMTKHKIFPKDAKAWRCAMPGCRLKPKNWLRLDNFRQHIIRIHGKNSETVQEIIASSTFQPLSGPNPQASQQDWDMATQEMVSDQEDSSDLQFADLSQYDEMLDSDLANVKPDWSPFTPVTNFDEFGGAGGSQSSYQVPSDLGSSPVERPHFTNAQPSSPSSFTAGSSSNVQALFDRNLSPGQSSWVSRSLGADQQGSRKNWAVGAAAPPKLRVVVHQADSDSGTHVQETFDLHAEAKAILQQGLPEDELHESLSNLLQASKMRRPSRNRDNQNNSRHVSLSPTRGRTSISNASSMLVSHGNNRTSDRAASQASDRSQSTNMRGRALGQDNGLCDGRIMCSEPGCEKRFLRQSQLDKHARRHQKPYACTFDECPCSKIFGSKNDWKRHESSQHMQENVWRCRACAKTFETEQIFASHLEVHGFTGHELAKHCREGRIGVNHSGSFWCGFCHSIIPLDVNKKGVAAWDERFNHIAAHFVPDKDHSDKQCKIEDWLPPDGKLTKGQIERTAGGAPQGGYSPYMEGPDDGGALVDDRGTYPFSNQADCNNQGSGEGQQSMADTPELIGRSHSNKRQRKGNASTTSSKTKAAVESVICHECLFTNAWGLYRACTGCNHEFCGMCTQT